MAKATGKIAASTTMSTAARRLAGTARRVMAAKAPTVPISPSASMISGNLNMNKCGR